MPEAFENHKETQQMEDEDQRADDTKYERSGVANAEGLAGGTGVGQKHRERNVGERQPTLNHEEAAKTKNDGHGPQTAGDPSENTENDEVQQEEERREQ
jgi:hypothetical protein